MFSSFSSSFCSVSAALPRATCSPVAPMAARSSRRRLNTDRRSIPVSRSFPIHAARNRRFS